MSVILNENECAAAGVSSRQVHLLAHRLNAVAREANKMGVTIFAGSGGSLRFHQRGEDRSLILATIEGSNWDGGDGGMFEDDAGLLRGE